MSHGTVGVASLRALLQAFTENGGCQWIIPGIKTTTNPLIYNWEVNCPPSGMTYCIYKKFLNTPES